MIGMTETEFTSRLKMLMKQSDLETSEKKCICLMAAYACDSNENEQLICNYLKKDGITLKSLADYIISISPDITEDE